MTSSTAAAERPRAASRERAIRTGLGILALVNLFVGAYMVIGPGSFVDKIGPFGDVNSHYVRDVASWTLAYAAVLFIAAGNRAWRVPVLGFGILQSAFHVVNHIVDVGDADPGWVGWFDVISLTALMGVMIWLLSAERSEVRR